MIKLLQRWFHNKHKTI